MNSRPVRNKRALLVLSCSCLLLVAANLFWGTASIPAAETIRILLGKETAQPSWHFIVIHSRLPQALTALLAGMGLATAGLLLQTVFNNPLAGPSVLGINAGASLGVAIVMLLSGGALGHGIALSCGYLAIITGAFLGAAVVLGLIIFFSTFMRSNIMLLIVGIMVGYLTSSLISLLNFFASADGVFSYMIWGMGDFSNVSLSQFRWFAPLVLSGIGGGLLLIKPLNALLLGERYAANLGVNVRLVRICLLGVTGLLTAVITAFCGPIAFIGLAVPHMARLSLGELDHTLLLPATILFGGAVALSCNLCCSLPGTVAVLPLNAITPIIGAPVILYILLNRRHIHYFN